MADEFGFIPDEPEKQEPVIDPSGFVPDELSDSASEFIPDTSPQPDESGFIPDLDSIPPPISKPIPPDLNLESSRKGFSTFDRKPSGHLETFLQTRALLAKPAEKSKEGLLMLADLLPSTLETTSPLVNFAGGVPHTVAEVGAEFASSFIHPDTAAVVVGLKGAGTILKSPMGQKFIQAIAKKIPEGLKRAVTYRFGQPQAYKDAAEQASINIRVGTEQVGTVAKNIEAFSSAEQKQIGAYMRGEVGAVVSPEMKAAGDAARAEFSRLGRDTVDLGLLDAETYQANINTYLPRLYRNKELAAHTPRLGSNKPLRQNLDRFKKRQDIPDDVRESMGEVLEAGYPTHKGLLQLNQAVEKGKMFRKVAQNPELTSATEASGIASGFERLPVTKALGDLSGRWVHREVARDINQILIPKSEMTKLWRKTLGTWKFGKVVLSAATHMRNIFTNSFWLDISGINHIRQAEAIPRMIKEIVSKGKFYKLSLENGLIGTELVGSEIRPFAEAMKGRPATNMWEMLQKGSDAAKKLANKAGKVYQAEEQVFKMVKFEDNLAKGMLPRDAALEAEQWIFNYEKVPPLIDAIRKSPLGVPFITYISKAIPQLAKAAVQNPLRVYKYSLFFDAMENTAQRQLGINQAQLDVVRERGVRLIPFKRGDKRGQTLDVDFLMPWGELGSAGKGPLFDKLPQPFTPSGPLFALNNALLANYDPFRKQNITSDTDTLSEKIAKTTDYLGKALLPNLTPGIPGLKSPFRGGYHFQELIDAFRGEARFPKREAKSIPEALLSTGLGLKTGPIDIPKEFGRATKRKVSKKNRLLTETKKLLKHEGVTEAEKRQLGRELAPKILEIFGLKPDVEMLQKGIKVERKLIVDEDRRTLMDALIKQKELSNSIKDKFPDKSVEDLLTGFREDRR